VPETSTSPGRAWAATRAAIMDGETAQVVAAQLHLTGMQARAQLEPEAVRGGHAPKAAAMRSISAAERPTG
jgi:hypothetical protein